MSGGGTMNVTELMSSRYTTKKFDPGKSIPEKTVEEIENLLHLAPSSTNIQPWHFVLASSQDGKDRVATAASGDYSYNAPKIKDASLVVVFCVRESLDDDYLEELLRQENTDGRFRSEKSMAGRRSGRGFFIDKHRYDLKDTQQWMEKQVYLAVGTLLLGAAELGLDACPMEGFDSRILDSALDLRKCGYTSSVIVALGYHSAEDFNASVPKSRWPKEKVIDRI